MSLPRGVRGWEGRQVFRRTFAHMLIGNKFAMLCIAGLGMAALAAALFVPSAGGGSSLEDRKTAVDAKIAELRDTVAEAKSRAVVLTSDLSAANEQIEALNAQLAVEGDELSALEIKLANERERLETLRVRLEAETDLLELQTEQAQIARALLEERVVELYKSNGLDVTATILLDISSLAELVDQLEYLRDIVERDDEILASVRENKAETRKVRTRTQRTRRAVSRATTVLANRTEAQRRARDAVFAREQEVSQARDDKSELLVAVRGTQSAAREDIRELAAASERLEQEILAAQRRVATPASSGSGRRPASGFIWPANGPLTSGFGPRWGRLHAGIDIGAGFGTPIRSVASGTVVYSGWLGGYGNLVVVDHGNGLSTAYAHQQQIYATVGQRVAQGTTLGEVGSTGNSTGPHLHFEVRINGSAVDPLGYL